MSGSTFGLSEEFEPEDGLELVFSRTAEVLEVIGLVQGHRTHTSKVRVRVRQKGGGNYPLPISCLRLNQAPG